MITEFCRTFFQQLPNGLCLIFAIGVIVCLVFVLPKRKHHNPLYAAFWLAILTMVLWRLVVGLVAVRYVSVLIIPAVMMTAFVGFRAESWWRWLHRRYRFLPRFVGRILPRLLVYGCSAGALAMAVYNCVAGQKFYQETYKTIREYRQKDPAARVLIQDDEQFRTRYYTGAATLRLKNNTRDEVKKFLNNPEANRTLLVVMRDRPKYSRIDFSATELAPGAEWKLLRRVKRASGRRNRNKELNIYVYIPPAKAVPCTEVQPLSTGKGNLIINGDLEKSVSGKQAQTMIPGNYRQSPFYRSAKFHLPAGAFHVASALRNPAIPLVKSVRGKEALRGSGALSAASRNNAVNFWISRNLAPGNYTFEFYLKGKPGTVVEVLSLGGTAGKKTLKKHLVYKLPDDQLYRCSTVVSAGQHPFIPGIRISSGEAVLDELFLARCGQK